MSYGSRGRFVGRGGGRRGGVKGLVSLGICKCIKCGREIPHSPRIPCSRLFCPECRIPMIRLAIKQNFSRNVQFQLQKPAINQLYSTFRQYNTQQMNLPIVDRYKCNGCSECVNQCPNGAISIKDNKAVIDYSKCRNCRICENFCPVNAIN